MCGLGGFPAATPLTIAPPGVEKINSKSIIKEIVIGADSNQVAYSTTNDQVFIDNLLSTQTGKALETTGSIGAINYVPATRQFVTATSSGLVQAWSHGAEPPRSGDGTPGCECKFACCIRIPACGRRGG